jgi:hypothetical protein
MTNERRVLKSPIDIWVWRFHKWHYDVDLQKKVLCNYLTLKDMFVLQDLLKETLNRTKSLYKDIFAPARKHFYGPDMTIRLQEKLSSFIWDVDPAKRPHKEEEEEQVREVITEEATDKERPPWEALLNLK